MKLWLSAVILLALLVGASGAGSDLRLVDAVKRADKTAVRALLKQRIDVNASEQDGTTALHWAARADDLGAVELLVRAGANVKIANRYGITALNIACTNGNGAIVEMLLKAGADPNTALPDGETALMTAARTGKVDAVKSLLAHGANVNAKESTRDQTALMWAAAEGNTDVVRVLLEHGADMHARSSGLGGFTALLFAAREGRIGAAKALVQAGADPNETLQLRRGDRQDGQMIVLARPPARAGRAGAPTAAPAGPPPNPNPNAFFLAVENAHYELALALVDLGVDPNAAPQGFTALHAVSWVRKSGIGDDEKGVPKGSGNISSSEFVRQLVARGANVNARVTVRRPPMGTTRLNAVGATPFLLAARTADAPLMRLFAKLGADPLLPNEDGSTPLLVAAGVGARSDGEDPGSEPEMVEAIKVALDLGANVNDVDKNGETVMHGVCNKFTALGLGGADLVHLLAEKGAKIEVWNKPNKAGLTPLAIVGLVYAGDPPGRAAIRQLMVAAGVSTELAPNPGRNRGGYVPPPPDGVVTAPSRGGAPPRAE